MNLHTRSLALLCAGFIMSCSGTPEEPHHADPAPRSQFVHLKEEAVRAASLEVTVVSREAFHPHITASGVIRAVAQRSVKVRAVTGGVVVRQVVDVGDRVQETQELATVVIGGLITSTLLTLIVLPAIYRWFTESDRAAPAPDRPS